jgi:hypothetical protein
MLKVYKRGKAKVVYVDLNLPTNVAWSKADTKARRARGAKRARGREVVEKENVKKENETTLKTS